ncbi:MAG TPA: hypothetical protein VJV79_19150 [Polyangiaceae bacterium]|nr:hypothetical protein [Polyangiaceae bacterium]
MHHGRAGDLPKWDLGAFGRWRHMHRLVPWACVIGLVACGGRAAVDSSPNAAQAGFPGFPSAQAGAPSTSLPAGGAGSAQGGSSSAGSASTTGGAPAIGGAPSTGMAGTPATGGGGASGGDATGGHPGQGEACTLELSKSCIKCKVAHCSAELESLKDPQCAPSLQCANQYCFFHDDCSCPPEDPECLHCPSQIALCGCVDSCSLPGDSHGCRSKWQRVYACLATHCADCVADDGGRE